MIAIAACLSWSLLMERRKGKQNAAVPAPSEDGVGPPIPPKNATKQVKLNEMVAAVRVVLEDVLVVKVIAALVAKMRRTSLPNDRVVEAQAEENNPMKLSTTTEVTKNIPSDIRAQVRAVGGNFHPLHQLRV